MDPAVSAASIEPDVTEGDAERRSTPRKTTFEEHGIMGVRVRPGRDGAVVDVSAGGMLIDTIHRLLPGTTVEVLLAGADRRTTIRGRIVRCAVASLHGSVVRYRGAVRFDRSIASFLDLDGYVIPTECQDGLQDVREDATHATI
jgi:PilZ domain